MKMIRGTLKLALILYICAALSGVYVLSASARITPHDGDDDTMLITVEKGDTLWDLCQEHLKDPLRWRELSKYNDFTNPHLIYPGEQLRIPLAMAKEVVQIAEDDLQKLRDELAAANALLEEAGRKETELQGEIAQLNSDLATLKEQLDALQSDLASAEDVNKQIGDLVNSTNKQVGDLADATNKQIGELRDQITANADKTKQEVESVKNELKVTAGNIATLQADVTKLLTQIETNQKAINEVKMILENAKGVHETPSTGKRALVFLTTVAAGIGWFAINAIGGRSGE